MEISGHGSEKVLLVWLESILDFSGGKLFNLLRSTADKGAGIKKSVELAQDWREESSATDPLNQVIAFTLFLDAVCRLVRENACETR